jgi:hypothetical protein
MEAGNDCLSNGKDINVQFSSRTQSFYKEAE